MERHVKKIVSNFKHVRGEVAEKLDHVLDAAEEIVEDGAGEVHHELPSYLFPSTSKMLPYPIGHCPLSSQPLYLPPSVVKPRRSLFKDIQREVARCFKIQIDRVANRPVKEMGEFTNLIEEKTIQKNRRPVSVRNRR